MYSTPPYGILDEEQGPTANVIDNDLATIQTSAQMNNKENDKLEKWKKRLRAFGVACFEKMDYIGGYVAYFLGVEESRYQWVIDSMDEEDIERAKQDYLDRKARDQVLFAEMGIDTGLKAEEEPEGEKEMGDEENGVTSLDTSTNTAVVASM